LIVVKMVLKMEKKGNPYQHLQSLLLVTM